MKKCLIAALFLSLPAWAQFNAFNGMCQKGGQATVTQGLPSTATQPLSGGTPLTGTGVIGSYPSCLVTVYLTGTTNLATIYSSAAGNTLTNPFTANLDGSYLFFSAPGAGLDIVTTFGTLTLDTLTDVLLGGGGGGTGNVVGPNPPTVAGDFVFWADTGAVNVYDGGTPGTMAFLNAANPLVGFGTTTQVPSSYFAQLTMGGSVLGTVAGASNLGSAAIPFGSGYFSTQVQIAANGSLFFVPIGASVREGALSADTILSNALAVGIAGNGDYSGTLRLTQLCFGGGTNCMTSPGGGGGSGAWSSLLAATQNVTIPLQTGGVAYTTLFQEGDFGASPVPSIFGITDQATSSTDNSYNLTVNTGNNSYHNPFEVSLTTGGVSYPQFQVCNTDGTSHVGITVIGNIIPCASLPTTGGTISLSGASKLWVMDGSPGHTQATLYDNSSGQTATNFQITSVSSGTTFNLISACTGVTPFASGGIGTCAGGSAATTFNVRADGLVTAANGYVASGTGAGYVEFGSAAAQAVVSGTVIVQGPASGGGYNISLPIAAPTTAAPYLDCPTPSGSPLASICTWAGASGGGAVSSVFGRTGAIVAASGDYTLGQVTPTSLLSVTSAPSTGTVGTAFTGKQLWVVPSSGGPYTFTITLLATAPTSGAYLDIINTGTGIITITPNGNQINGGSANVQLGPGTILAPSSVHIVSDGANYWTGNGLTSDCAAAGTAASPSVVSCGAAITGSFSCATNSSAATCQVNTTAVTANSRIKIQPSSAEGANLSVTCNTSSDTGLSSPRLASKTPGTGFVINLGTFTTNPMCFNFTVEH